jgi:hypothetical protein
MSLRPSIDRTAKSLLLIAIGALVALMLGWAVLAMRSEAGAGSLRDALVVLVLMAAGAIMALTFNWIMVTFHTFLARDRHAAASLVQSVYERVRDRAQREAIARLRFPELTDAEVAMLDDGHLKIDSFAATPVVAPIPRGPGSRWMSSRLAGDGDQSRYVGLDQKSAVVDGSLPAPRIDVAWEGGEPSFAMPKQYRDGVEALYYWEVDTSPAFASPNLWRMPVLMPAFWAIPKARQQNLTGRSGMPFALLHSQRRDDDGHANVLTFPFRPSAMCLPTDWHALDFEAMRRHARALTYGLGEEAAIAEVFRYVRQTYPWANDSIVRQPLDTFRAGLGACGAVNDFMGCLLELSGIRYRGVAGYHPAVKALRGFDGSGHSAIEVWSEQKWSYLDAYLDIYTPGVSSKDLASGDPHGSIPVRSIVEERRASTGPQMLAAGDLFKVRLYYDKRNRLPLASMFELQGMESSYGSDWQLDTAPAYRPEELFPEEITIHVRGRYMFAGGARIVHPSEPAPQGKAEELRLSPWSEVRITVRPRDRHAAQSKRRDGAAVPAPVQL